MAFLHCMVWQGSVRFPWGGGGGCGYSPLGTVPGTWLSTTSVEKSTKEITCVLSKRLPTLHHSPRRRNSTNTFSAGWKEQVFLHPSSPLSTGEPLSACWPAASLSGTGTVVQQIARPFSGQWTQLQRSSVPLSLPKHPPTLPHYRKNCLKLSNTLASIRTRHFSHTTVFT